MEPISPISADLGGGVTLEPAPLGPKGSKKSPRARIWCFTWNNYDEISRSHLSQYFDERDVKYVFQAEIGEQGTPHFQGVVQFANQKTLSALKVISPKIHWEVCRDLKTSIKYCSKEEGRVDGPWFKGFKPPISLAERYRVYTALLPWQQELKQELQALPERRKILWYYNESGEYGKTEFCRHMLCFDKNFTWVACGEHKDIAQSVGTVLEANPDLNKVAFTFGRAVRPSHVPYESIEQIKDGLFFAPKYKSRPFIMAPPHVVIFANMKPDITQLSADRWVIREV